MSLGTFIRSPGDADCEGKARIVVVDSCSEHKASHYEYACATDSSRRISSTISMCLKVSLDTQIINARKGMLHYEGRRH
jgi:hypothetical protein